MRTTHIRLVLAAAAVIGTAAPLFGQQIAGPALYPVSLEDCIETGLQNNYSVRIMRNLEQVAKNNATRGNAGQLPTVGLSASYGGFQTQNAPFSNTIQAGLDVNWTLFEGFGIRANYQKLQELKLQGELDMRLTLEDFVASVSSEYFHLIRQRIRLRNLNRSVTLSRERLRIVQESFHIGAASGLDYQQAQVDFNADTSDYLAQTELVRKSVINLNRLLALDDIERKTVPADTAIIFNALLDRDKLWNRALTNNTSLLMAMSDQTVSELDLKRVQSRNYPYLKLNAGYDYRNNNQTGPSLGASMGFTLFDAGNRRREQINARLDIENSRLRQEQIENSLKADMASLWMAYQNNLEMWNIEKSNLVVARSNFEIAMERYRLRELSGIELREAQLSLLQSEERLSTVEYNIKVCEISLLMLSGDILTYSWNTMP